MSACIDLYRLSDVKYILNGLNAMSCKDIEKLSDEDFEKFWETCNTDCWEDRNEHYLIDISRYKYLYSDTRGWARQKARLDRLTIQSGIVDTSKNICKYIVADLICCYSGSILKKRYYNKETWLVVCTTKKEVINFFSRYGDEGYTAIMNSILSKWDDKTFMIVNY